MIAAANSNAGTLIRLIKPSDNGAVATVIRTVMSEFGAIGRGFSIEDPEVDAMFEAHAAENARFYVVEHKKLLVGCGGISQLHGGNADTCEIKKMYFMPEVRGNGVGRLLAELLLQDAARVGFRKVYIETLDTMTAANRLYQRLGFTQLNGSLGNTGHCGCDTYYLKEVQPTELDPSLLA